MLWSVVVVAMSNPADLAYKICTPHPQEPMAGTAKSHKALLFPDQSQLADSLRTAASFARQFVQALSHRHHRAMARHCEARYRESRSV